jgi:hypothetical protein
VCAETGFGMQPPQSQISATPEKVYLAKAEVM